VADVVAIKAGFLSDESPYAGNVDFPEAAADGNKGLAAPFGPVG
jgi:hypothetical protein